VWSCDQCHKNVTSNPLICDACGAAAPGADPDTVAIALQRDLAIEAHLRALALWHRIGAVLVAVIAIAVMVQSGIVASRLSAEGLGDAVGLWLSGATVWVCSIVLAMCAGSYVLGHFLARYVDAARIVAGVLAVIELVLAVVRTCGSLALQSHRYSPYGSSSAGTILAFLLNVVWTSCVAWVLLSSRAAHVCRPQYRTLVARTPALQPPTYRSPFFLIPTIVVALALLIALLLYQVR
jgi:hypothetical protein